MHGISLFFLDILYVHRILRDFVFPSFLSQTQLYRETKMN